MTGTTGRLFKPTINRKSGAVFLTLFLLGALWLTDDFYLGQDIESAFKATRTVWEIRSLAQDITYRAMRDAQASSGVDADLSADTQAFNKNLVRLREIGFHLVDLETSSLVELAERELGYRWGRYRRLLQRLGSSGNAEHRSFVNDLEAANGAIVATTDAVVQQVVRAAQQARRRATVIREVTVTVGFALLVLFMTALHVGVVRPVRLIAREAMRFSDGNMPIMHIDYKSDDEIGDLANTLNRSWGWINQLLETTGQQARKARRDAAHLRTILDSVPDAMLITDGGGLVRAVNGQAEYLLGYPRNEICGKPLDTVVPGVCGGIQCPQDCRAGPAAGPLGAGMAVEMRAKRRDGTEFPADISMCCYKQDGSVRCITVIRDISERLEREEMLRLRESAITCASNGIVITDARRRGLPIVYVNPAFERITGYARKDVLGRSPMFLHKRDRDQAGLAEVREAVRRGRTVSAVIRNYRKDGKVFWNDLQISPITTADGSVSHYVGIVNDVSDRVAYEQALKFQASHDALTGTFNRHMLDALLNKAIDQARRRSRNIAVVYIDLDNFKIINDSLGHIYGDELLKQVSHRLHHSIRSSDVLARQGGDEFIVILTDMEREEDVWAVTRKILDNMVMPFGLKDHEVTVTVSIGASLYPKDGDDAGTLLMHADAAMYQGKARGKNQVQLFDHEMNAVVRQRLQIETALRRAVDNQEFLLHYQPQVDLQNGNVVGLESLLRWAPAEDRLVAPAEFIPVLEETGLIVPVGAWILRAACEQAKAWNDEGHRVRIAVNLSGRQLRDPHFPQMVADILDQCGLDPRLLELELTESMLLPRAEYMLAEIRRLGVSLSVDDFGTGYSNLSHMDRFPITRLKIDRGFVRGLVDSAGHRAIVEAVIAMGRGLGMMVCAEGVEHPDQVRLLIRQGCHEAQGFLFSAPLAAADVRQVLTNGVAVEGGLPERL